ncbi:exosortase family protein XrtF [Adhaeribacter sp. BT258]|uniref:Exosortase family protein XrtF n=1 Tax=Adhaeribacter terrigena TaxID=2793070 RepID=A0ABS1C556_9BACT|nr:exosortase family protein XrtF [Adhaeribacter terrigena]MBK0404489.1 exosortase family protein XrtF [Adhaeribacter terrigena]
MDNSRQIIRFLGTALALYAVWYICYDLYYDHWFNPFTSLDTWITMQEVRICSAGLNLLNYKASYIENSLLINNHPVVLVANGCNGMTLFILFAGFIIAYPGPWKAKLLYMIPSIFLIAILNIFRILALALNSFHNRETLEFNHKYTFTFIVYLFIFGLWMLWIKRYAKPDPATVSA